jgi:hypothetical protein
MPIKKLTSAVDTMAGPCEDETTTLDTTMADHSGLAWGADDDDDEQPQRRSWEDAGSAAAVLLVGGVAAAVAVYVAIASSHHNDVQVSAPVTSAAAVVPSAPVVVTTVTESPVTVTVTPTPTTAPATTAAAVPSTTALRDGDDDASMPTTTYVAPAPVPQMNYSLQATTWFLQGVRMHGWTGSDALAIQLGRRICVITATDPAHMKGYEASRQLAAETGIPLAQIKEPIQIDALMQFCPQYLPANY